MIPELNNIVRNNTLSPARVANALDAGKVYLATGTDTYAVTVGATITAYALGDKYTVQIPNANTVTTPTLNVTGASALGAKTITGNDGGALTAADLKANGIYEFVYDGTNLRVINIGGGGGGGGTWGSITGTLSSQTDLQTALNGKLSDSGDTMSGNLAMGSNKVTGLAAASANGEAVRYEQLIEKLDKLITTNRQTASYPLALTDATKLVEMNVASANDLTVPLNSSVAFPTGTQILISQYGAGQTTIVATGGVTIRSAGGALKLRAQYSQASLIKIATDEWYAGGDLTT
jgi:hypothetical protein